MKILVVEDEPRLAEVLREGFLEAGYLVDVASDGNEGLGLAVADGYDLVVLDLMLPGCGGIAICREIRRRNIDACVLMLTARDTLSNKVEGLDSGADDYMTKPFEFPELLARSRSLLRRSSRSRSRILTIADLEIDTAAHEVHRGNVSISLTPREYALLEYLAYNAGRPLTRDQILTHVWRSDYEGYSNTVDVFIRYLRRKIDDGREPKLIKTIVGVGYALRAPHPE